MHYVCIYVYKNLNWFLIVVFYNNMQHRNEKENIN